MKLGIFGGAFDPIHNGHLFVADTMRSVAGLDRIVFLPTRAGQHRAAPRAGVDDRAAMIRMAIASNPHFALDLRDTDDEATGYTADVVPRLRAVYPRDDLYFIAGSDSLIHSRWSRLESILHELAGFLVAPRGEHGAPALDAALDDIPNDARGKIRLVDLPRVGDSATLVRARCDAGESVRYLVPEPVWRYLTELKLYHR